MYANKRRGAYQTPQCGTYLSNYCNLQLKSLLHLGQNVITFRTLSHLGSFITFRPSTPVRRIMDLVYG